MTHLKYNNSFRFPVLKWSEEYKHVSLLSLINILTIIISISSGRRWLDMRTWRGLLDFWRRMMKKLEATVA